jgi:hypothetical protein
MAPTMIPATAHTTVRHVPVGSILIGEDLHRDVNKVITYAALLEDNPDQDMEPVILHTTVSGMYRIVNGHHRFVAAIIAGRPELLAVIVA